MFRDPKTERPLASGDKIVADASGRRRSGSDEDCGDGGTRCTSQSLRNSRRRAGINSISPCCHQHITG